MAHLIAHLQAHLAIDLHFYPNYIADQAVTPFAQFLVRYKKICLVQRQF